MTQENNYVEVDSGGGAPIRAWVKGVMFEAQAEQQLRNAAQLPFIFRWIAAMPDVHMGIGATVGSVIPTKGAIIPAAVGVDIGCGMAAVRTSLVSSDLPDDLKSLRTAIEAAVPHGRTDNGGRKDIGAWHDVPERNRERWASLERGYEQIVAKHPKFSRNAHPSAHLGTLGTGNHFIEVCLDESDRVWIMLHSGSRGVGNRIGSYFIELAKKDMRQVIGNLPDRDLAYLEEGTEHFNEYVDAVGLGAELRADQPRAHDGGDPRSGPIDARNPAVYDHRRSGELPSQLRRPRNAFRRGGVGHAQGRGAGGARASSG